jgi:Flp pilus assembly pilin Flp
LKDLLGNPLIGYGLIAAFLAIIILLALVLLLV